MEILIQSTIFYNICNTIVYYGDVVETVTTKLTRRLTQEIDELIEEGWFANRSEAIRDAVRELIERKKFARLKKVIEKDIQWGLYGK